MAKASVLYLFQTQEKLNPEAQKSLMKSLARLGLDHVYISTNISQAAPESQQQWARELLLPFANQQGITLETTATPVPLNAPTETMLWVIAREAIQDYLIPFTDTFCARDCDLVVVNTQKKNYRSLAF